jgi:hypothetical protein
MLKELNGHKGWIYRVAWNDNHIVSASQDGTARIWDPDSGEQISVIPASPGWWVYSAEISGDGSRVALAGEDGKVFIYGAEFLSPIAELMSVEQQLRQLTEFERQTYLHTPAPNTQPATKLGLSMAQRNVKRYSMLVGALHAVALLLCCDLGCAGEPATMSDPDYGFDRAGGDYRNFAPRTSDPTLCEEACANDTRCLAWSYVKPHSAKGPHPACWLKNIVPDRKEVSHVVSGIKIHRASP